MDYTHCNEYHYEEYIIEVKNVLEWHPYTL